MSESKLTIKNEQTIDKYGTFDETYLYDPKINSTEEIIISDFKNKVDVIKNLYNQIVVLRTKCVLDRDNNESFAKIRNDLINILKKVINIDTVTFCECDSNENLACRSTDKILTKPENLEECLNCIEKFLEPDQMTNLGSLIKDKKIENHIFDEVLSKYPETYIIKTSNESGVFQDPTIHNKVFNYKLLHLPNTLKLTSSKLDNGITKFLLDNANYFNYTTEFYTRYTELLLEETDIEIKYDTILNLLKDILTGFLNNFEFLILPDQQLIIEEHTKKPYRFKGKNPNFDTLDKKTIQIGFTKGKHFIPTIINENTTEYKSLNYKIAQFWMSLRYIIMHETEFQRNCDIYEMIPNTCILTFNKSLHLVHINTNLSQSFADFFKFPENIEKLEDQYLENIAVTTDFREKISVTQNDSISSGAIEINLKEPNCSIRVNWSWENTFEGITIVMNQSVEETKPQTAYEQMVDNFSYVMEPIRKSNLNDGTPIHLPHSDISDTDSNVTPKVLLNKDSSKVFNPIDFNQKHLIKDPLYKSSFDESIRELSEDYDNSKLSSISENNDLEFKIQPKIEQVPRKRTKKNKTYFAKVSFKVGALYDDNSLGTKLKDIRKPRKSMFMNLDYSTSFSKNSPGNNEQDYTTINSNFF